MRTYANVIVDISLEKLDKTFQYLIPPHLTEAVCPGVLVEVPFGNGNRLVHGYVVEVTDTAEFDEERMKEIAGVVTEGIPVEAQLIALAAWMRTYFGGTMNQALKTVLPVKRKTAKKEHRLVYLCPDEAAAREALAECERRHYTARARLLGALLAQSPLPYETVTAKLNVTASVIRTMQEKGLVLVERVRDYRNPLDRMKKQGQQVQLNASQQQIADDILTRREAGERTPCLIHGVTGSGKTEVYIELIEAAVKKGQQAIVLIPEIALTFQTVLRFYNHFGDRVSILNSRMSAGERFDQYERAKNGELDVMIGPRSALFTPFSNLGFIIIDEEHEASYKSETVPCYHARETAIARAELCDATVVLGSATPSVESYYRAKRGEYRLYEMADRVGSGQLPKVYIADMRRELKEGNRSILSRQLREMMEDRLSRGEQIMLFINRRGMAGFVSCRSCGHVIKCPHCDVSLNLHNNGRLVCHYCGYTQPAVKLCPECGSPYIGAFRAGTQKIESYVREQFPGARVLRMDLDTTRQKDGYEKVLSAFANREADILIGTQMIVKGHDFPNVTLVGALAADLSLYISDYRASERTFQLLTQAAGRAGRGEQPGEVVIQTYQPEHFAVTAAAAQDYKAFYEREISFRTLMRYPPVWHMLVVHIASDKETLVNEAASVLQYMINAKTGKVQSDTKCSPGNRDGVVMPEDRQSGMEESGDMRSDARKAGQTQVIGPANAAVAKVNDIYRKVIYVKSADYGELVSIKNELEHEIREHAVLKKAMVQFDFNPMNGF
ncbi:MAG: primosomal protein N' [Clostridiales bacterium]|nr:primosomal protein N' [Clostridiales bacterium]